MQSIAFKKFYFINETAHYLLIFKMFLTIWAFD